MNLETEGKIHKNNVTRSDIVEAFEDDKGRGEFIILSQSQQVYMQAAGEGYGPYTLEYREGDDESHFQCSQDLEKSQVREAFIKYLEGDESWKTSHEWKTLEQVEQEAKPWWKFW